VTVTTRHPGAKDSVDYKLTRATIDLIPVSFTMCPAAGGTRPLCLFTRLPLVGRMVWLSAAAATQHDPKSSGSGGRRVHRRRHVQGGDDPTVHIQQFLRGYVAHTLSPPPSPPPALS